MKLKLLHVRRFASALIICVAIPSALSAATFKSVGTKDGKTIVLLSGEILEGDAETLKTEIKTANDAGKLVSGVRLNSAGGNLLEALKLADIVRFAKVATNVAGNATCASACFLVYAAGATKFANYTAQVGVHGASDKQGDETIASGADLDISRTMEARSNPLKLHESARPFFHPRKTRKQLSRRNAAAVSVMPMGPFKASLTIMNEPVFIWPARQETRPKVPYCGRFAKFSGAASGDASLDINSSASRRPAAPQVG